MNGSRELPILLPQLLDDQGFTMGGVSPIATRRSVSAAATMADVQNRAMLSVSAEGHESAPRALSKHRRVAHT